MTAAEDRFARLYDDHFPSVYAYCRRRTDPQRAEDAVADVFLTAWRRIDHVPQGRAALLWLYGVAHKVLAHQWRASGRRARLDQKLRSVGAEAQHPLDYVVVVREEVRQVLDAAARLNPNDLEVLLLSVWEGLSHAAVAEVLGISVGAVKQRLHRARVNLADEYERMQSRKDRFAARQRGGGW